MRDLRSWNRATILRHLLNIISRGGSIWVAWMLKYRVKGKSIWMIKDCSGCWL
ncbi:hypothetical protein LINPERHAP2_LOCUS23111 [Linum perenne]